MTGHFIGQLAGLITVIAYIPYIVSIINGRTKPERATFAIWTFVNVVLLFSLLSVGAKDIIWFILANTLMQFIVFILSLGYGVGGANRLDKACVVGAVIGMVLWGVTSNPAIAVYLATISEFLGFLPLYRKIYFSPHSENLLSWIFIFLASLINLFAISSLSIITALYPTYVFFAYGLVVTVLIISRHVNVYLCRQRLLIMETD